MLDKILVCCPTAKAKNYCFDSWLENVMNFSYPNFQIRMFDNTIDEGENAKYLNSVFEEKYGIEASIDGIFYAQNSIILNKSKSKNVIDNMVYSHNDCRDYMLKNNYPYMLHLESDVFPNTDIIESLLLSRKKVVGGIYYIDEGIYRKIMIQKNHEMIFSDLIVARFIDHQTDLNFINGNLQEVSHVGLGCVLIHKSVFKNIKFRYENGSDCQPDSYFAEDCFRNGIKIFADTSKICRHDNRLWIFQVN